MPIAKIKRKSLQNSSKYLFLTKLREYTRYRSAILHSCIVNFQVAFLRFGYTRLTYLSRCRVIDFSLGSYHFSLGGVVAIVSRVCQRFHFLHRL